jgi:hypothetical protein
LALQEPAHQLRERAWWSEQPLALEPERRRQEQLPVLALAWEPEPQRRQQGQLPVPEWVRVHLPPGRAQALQVLARRVPPAHRPWVPGSEQARAPEPGCRRRVPLRVSMRVLRQARRWQAQVRLVQASSARGRQLRERERELASEPQHQQRGLESGPAQALEPVRQRQGPAQVSVLAWEPGHLPPGLARVSAHPETVAAHSRQRLHLTAWGRRPEVDREFQARPGALESASGHQMPHLRHRRHQPLEDEKPAITKPERPCSQPNQLSPDFGDWCVWSFRLL